MVTRNFTDAERRQLALDAFNGLSEALYDHCLTAEGYMFAGTLHQANGLSELDCINAVALMGDEEIEECLAIDGR